MSKKILVVDDERSIVRLLSLRLRKHNFKVLEAHDGYECVEKAKLELPDLILLDIRMPYGGGIMAFDKMRSMPNVKKIPVIFITAYPKTKVKELVMKKGAAGFVAKPFDSDILMNTINDALSGTTKLGSTYDNVNNSETSISVY